jgi:hypothetical protein
VGGVSRESFPERRTGVPERNVEERRNRRRDREEGHGTFSDQVGHEEKRRILGQKSDREGDARRGGPLCLGHREGDREKSGRHEIEMAASVAFDHDQRVPSEEEQSLLGQAAAPQEEEERFPEPRLERKHRELNMSG